ncbi:hypothetical protein BDQ17DRAFT_1537874 [Cyathus striatus]|nr:hypothetical protein BDQ17DRAFT_1537874 [Cyathus striatus]
MKTLQLDAYFRSYFYAHAFVPHFTSIYKLHVDLFIDRIFIHLCVEDVLALRQVNRPFYLLTLTPVIWQRFLERMRISTPPPRQVFRCHFELDEYEAEDLVRRNLCLDRNWRQYSGHAFHHRSGSSFGDILEMKLVPGGKYLVASVKDPTNMRFYIVVYAMDNPNGPKALVRSQTFAKAYGIQAKYIQFDGQDGIVIVYTRAVLRNGAPYDANEKLDPFNPPSYEVVALHISLHALDVLANPVASEVRKLAMEQPEPFTEVSELTFEKPIDEVTLFSFHGKPYISATQNPNQITFVDLLTKNLVKLICKHEPEYTGMFVQLDHIDALRVLPDQREVLVVRSFLLEDMTVAHVLCLYALPGGGDCKENPISQYVLKGNLQYVNCQISDHQISTPVNEWTLKNFCSPRPRIPSTPPPPISIFFRTIEPNGIVQLRIFPEKFIRKGTLRFRYGLDNVTKHTVYDMNQSVSSPFVLPGAHRAAVFKLWRYYMPHVMPEKLQNNDDDFLTEELDHTLLDIGRYVHPDDVPSPPEEPLNRDAVTRIRPSADNSFLPLWCADEIAAINASGGLRAIAFDETIGRLCVVPKLDSMIYVFDFTHLPLDSDERHRRWKRDREWLLENFPFRADRLDREKTYSEIIIRLFYDKETEETHVIYRPPIPMQSIEELEPDPCSP